MSLVQAEMEGAVTTTNKQLVVLESKLEELNLSSDDDEEAGSKEGKAEVLRQLEEERKALEVSRTLLDELLLKAQEEAVSKAAAKAPDSPTNVRASFGNNIRDFQAGLVNGGVVYNGK